MKNCPFCNTIPEEKIEVHSYSFLNIDLCCIIECPSCHCQRIFTLKTDKGYFFQSDIDKLRERTEEKWDTREG